MITRTMHAAVLTGPARIELARVPVPEPGPGQVRVALEGCGVCASNVEPWLGQPWSTFPGEPGGLGHEGWGVIDAVGDGVDLAPGAQVATLSGRSFAEYDLASLDQVIALPEALAGQPFPAEPFGCAVNVAARADLRPGQWVAVIGAGFIGAVVTRLASRAGARVIAISRRASSRALARTMGAEVTIPMDDHWKIIEAVKTVTGEALCLRVIECVGAQWPLDLATELVGFGGRLVIAGYHQDGPRQVNMQAWNWKGIDVSNAHERDPAVQRGGAERAAAAVASGEIDAAPLLTHRFALGELAQALAATRDKPEGFVKAIIDFGAMA